MAAESAVGAACATVAIGVAAGVVLRTTDGSGTDCAGCGVTGGCCDVFLITGGTGCAGIGRVGWLTGLESMLSSSIMTVSPAVVAG